MNPAWAVILELAASTPRQSRPLLCRKTSQRFRMICSSGVVCLRMLRRPVLSKLIGQEAFFCDGQSVGKTVAPWSSFVGTNLDLSGVTTIGQSAFNSCSSLKSVIRLDSIRNLGERAFGDCSSVQVVDMSKAGNSITFASNAFTQLGNDSVIYVASNLDSLAGIYSRDMTALAVTNGGTFSDSATFTVGTLATPVKDNSVFGGWYTKDGTNGDWGNKVTSSTETDCWCNLLCHVEYSGFKR